MRKYAGSNGTGWIDKAHGIVHIPIADAMRQVAQEGIPGWPAPTGKQPMRLRFLLVLLLAAPQFAVAASPPDFSGLAYEQRPGNRLPLQAVLRDETGRSVRLTDLFGGKPLILALGYFHCPNLCGVVRADLFDALARVRNDGGPRLRAGRLEHRPVGDRAPTRPRPRQMIWRAIPRLAQNRIGIS